MATVPGCLAQIAAHTRVVGKCASHQRPSDVIIQDLTNDVVLILRVPSIVSAAVGAQPWPACRWRPIAIHAIASRTSLART
eukprot:scaffold222513_cov31-Tisochrysis_lutea.AAC.1